MSTNDPVDGANSSAKTYLSDSMRAQTSENIATREALEAELAELENWFDSNMQPIQEADATPARRLTSLAASGPTSPSSHTTGGPSTVGRMGSVKTEDEAATAGDASMIPMATSFTQQATSSAQQSDTPVTHQPTVQYITQMWDTMAKEETIQLVLVQQLQQIQEIVLDNLETMDMNSAALRLARKLGSSVGEFATRAAKQGSRMIQLAMENARLKANVAPVQDAEARDVRRLQDELRLSQNRVHELQAFIDETQRNESNAEVRGSPVDQFSEAMEAGTDPGALNEISDAGNAADKRRVTDNLAHY